MFRLEKSFRFEAAHRLPHHDGKCRRLHGHSFVGRMVVEDYELHTVGPKQGMVADYADLSAAIQPILDSHLDHHYLNDTLGMESPTSEEIARWLYVTLAPRIRLGLTLVEVQVEETCTSKATYCPGARL